MEMWVNMESNLETAYRRGYNSIADALSEVLNKCRASHTRKLKILTEQMSNDPLEWLESQAIELDTLLSEESALLILSRLIRRLEYHQDIENLTALDAPQMTARGRIDALENVKEMINTTAAAATIGEKTTISYLQNIYRDLEYADDEENSSSAVSLGVQYLS